MNFRDELLKEHSRRQTLKVAAYIGEDKKLFKDLMDLFFANEHLVTQRAAAVVNESFTRYPELIQPYLRQLLENLNKTNLHDAVKRNTVRMLQFIVLPKKLQGLAFEMCLKLFVNPAEAIAIKVFAMTVLANICQEEKDLRHELILLIRQQMPYGSTGFCNRGGKILKQLEKLK